MKFKFLTNTFISLILIIFVCADDETVLTTHGLVSGKILKTLLKQKQYHGFMGIGYATPPLKDLRFMPPKDIEPWKDVLKATKEKPPCLQYNYNVKKVDSIGQSGIEDCLYLDIFTPAVDENKRGVVVFLYNEYFRYSYNKTKDYAPDFFIEEDVVVVTISHRLSVFGFLSFQDDFLHGNSGLKDIVMALEWIKNNIERFGGDPNKITLMGFKGGAAAIDLLIHTKAKNLINGAILHSGTSLTPDILQDDVRERAFKLGELLDIGTKSSKKLLKYLNDIAPEKLLSKDFRSLPDDFYKENQKPILAFGPVIEVDSDGLVLHRPESLHDPVNIPIMIGSNSRDGLDSAIDYLIDPKQMIFIEKDFHFLLPIRIEIKFDPLKDEYYKAIDEIKNFYFKKGKVTLKSVSDYVTYIGDVLTTYPVDVMTRKYANKTKNSLYYYHFDYYSELNANKNRILSLSEVSDGTWGASSGDELCYLFKCPILKNNYLKLNKSMSEEIIFQKKLVKLWANFIKYGSPTPAHNNPLENFEWPTYNLETKEYLHIGKNIEIRRNLFEDRFEFWDKFLTRWPKILRNSREKDEL